MHAIRLFLTMSLQRVYFLRDASSSYILYIHRLGLGSWNVCGPKTSDDDDTVKRTRCRRSRSHRENIYVYDLCRKVIYRPEIAYCEKLTSCARVMTTAPGCQTHKHTLPAWRTHGAATTEEDDETQRRSWFALLLLLMLLLIGWWW